MNWLSEGAPSHLQPYFQQLAQSLSAAHQALLTAAYRDQASFRDRLNHVCACSEFFRIELQRRSELFVELVQEHALDAAHIERKAIAALVSQWDNDTANFDRALRRQRAKAMLRIIWRDFNRLASLEETTGDLSALACDAIQAALEFHSALLYRKHGQPRSKKGEIQPLLVIGMGKLGAEELNLSSDIDLIFCYPNNGETVNGLSNQEFFSRLGKGIIHSLDAPTADGFVFRVDMRLRPYGQSGALVYSFGAMEEYYQTQGREWERYAMVKARVVASSGNAAHTARLMSMLQNFTYRKYVDFSVIEALRKLKQMIRQEVTRRQLEDDVKLGSGGIREIEFTAQVFQLIRGGRDTELRDNRILRILPQLQAMRCLPADAVEVLLAAYYFLRNTEHAIQGYKDQQTQKLPSDPQAQAALIQVMGFTQWQDFIAALKQHRQHVHAVFEQVIADPRAAEGDEKCTHWQAIWMSPSHDQTSQALLTEAGHENAQLSISLLQELAQWANSAGMHTSSKERLDSFMPILLEELCKHSTPTQTLQRIIKLVKAVARRSAYLLLLIENRDALTQLLKLTQASPWIADRLSDHPALLDELLDPSTLYDPPAKAELQIELQQTMLRIAEDDLEAQMEALRYFRSAHSLRVAASEISGVLPLMKVSDYLTWIAEVILEFALTNAWREMVRKHGYPDGEVRDTPNLAIIAYGKLGGIELSHGSDLDLVFVHGAALNGESDGERRLDNQTYYTRLGQKIIHFITTKLSSGALYEVDMRLRPSGNSGLLVSSIESFANYQRDAAWTWEHQALVRARVIAGDILLAERFREIRHTTLCKKRDIDALRHDVIEMRNKMKTHLGSSVNDHDTFHLKHDAGGIVDIEFMVQYAVLAWAHAHPALAMYTDNIRILESIPDSKGLTTQEVGQLIEAYKAFRTVGHRLTLQQLPNTIGAEELVAQREVVTSIWQQLMGARQ